MDKSKTEIYLDKCRKIWGDKYDYSTTIYKSSHEYIEYTCKEHGIIKQIAYTHLKSCCPKCSRIKYTKDNFIEKANKIHNNIYDYSLIESVNGVNSIVDIICNIHGTFSQKISEHINSIYGCKKCYYDSLKINTDLFISKSKYIHNDLYDYSSTKYADYNTKVNINCRKHGEFYQLPNHHLKGSGCPVCRSSKGELKIMKYLKDNNINYIQNKRFNDCKFKKELPFDFYLIDFNMCIEYDGEMHFKEIENFGGKTKLLDYQRNDKIKNEYCEINNIKLLRIKYTDFDKIDDILKLCIN
jgi:very-short-patch-repair endonuclease